MNSQVKPTNQCHGQIWIRPKPVVLLEPDLQKLYGEWGPPQKKTNEVGGRFFFAFVFKSIFSCFCLAVVFFFQSSCHLKPSFFFSTPRFSGTSLIVSTCRQATPDMSCRWGSNWITHVEAALTTGVNGVSPPSGALTIARVGLLNVLEQCSPHSTHEKALFAFVTSPLTSLLIREFNELSNEKILMIALLRSN